MMHPPLWNNLKKCLKHAAECGYCSPEMREHCKKELHVRGKGASKRKKEPHIELYEDGDGGAEGGNEVYVISSGDEGTQSTPNATSSVSKTVSRSSATAASGDAAKKRKTMSGGTVALSLNRQPSRNAFSRWSPPTFVGPLLSTLHIMLINFIVACGLPFSFFEIPEEIELLTFLCSNVAKALPSRETLRGSILQQRSERADANHIKKIDQELERGWYLGMMMDSAKSAARKCVSAVVIRAGDISVCVE